MNLKIFYQNIKKIDKFNPHSFVGKFILQGVWSDIDYWGLDSDLVKIYKHYKNKELPKDIFAGIVSIMTDICGICEKSEIYIDNEYYLKNDDGVIPDLYSRYERLKVLCECIVYKHEFECIDFWYNPKDKFNEIS
ncbi:Imm41 family immunity protein [Campylobacter geochelonis]|uniref:Uncharacterized protein n=2 Tax=Campylobacter geochelonis TaxID=1780362 RepID=A0A128EC93_9BACT|nr:Imm41 family immunity protein [Campylobacter geochelonis]QKF72169.1 immunity protein 41 [Campylobacter geochelonis]CZE46590.1 Uncharacterised protein [Campylobacter geochelonis]